MNYELQPLNESSPAKRESDRNQLLLDVGQAIVSTLSLNELFKTISNYLRRFIRENGIGIYQLA